MKRQNRTGKIARLPHAIKERLNQRLLDNQPASQILPWLNPLPEVIAVMAEYFAAAEITEQNLSEWRHGGFADWSQDNDRTRSIRQLSTAAAGYARASGGRLAEGAIAIAGGKVLELMEDIAAAEGADPELLVKMVQSLTALRSQEIAQQRADQGSDRLKQLEQSQLLERQKFEQSMREYQDKVAAQKATIEGALSQARAGGGLTPETLEKIEEAARLL